MGEVDIIMQRDSANLLYKKVQNKLGEQVNFVYDFVLEHIKGLVRPASLWIVRKTLNLWKQTKFRMTVTA